VVNLPQDNPRHRPAPAPDPSGRIPAGRPAAPQARSTGSAASANLIGAACVDLGNRFTHYPEWRQVDASFGPYLSRGAHAIVRCPATWVPQFVNGGHECLVVRAFEVMTDPLSPDQFSSAADRHVAQRNIAVALSQSPAQIDLPLDLGWPKAPGKATVEIEVATPSSMEFLRLYAGPGGPTYTAATEPLAAGLLPPALRGTRTASLSHIPFEHRKVLLRPSETFDRGCDPAQVGFHASVPGLKKDEAYVVRTRVAPTARCPPTS